MSDRQAAHRKIVEEFRGNGGRVGGEFAGIPLLLLTTTGARTGERRTWPVTYLTDGDRLVVFAANGGRPTHPAWYHNLLADPHATVEVGTEAFDATASVVGGPEAQRLWDRAATERPVLARVRASTSRVIPVIALSRSITRPATT